MILAGRKHQFDRIAHSVDERMNLGRQSAARSADRLRAVFFSSARTVLVSAHDRGVDHHVFVVGVARQQLENAIENAALRPSVKALVYDVPVAKTRGQITPRDSRSISSRVSSLVMGRIALSCLAPSFPKTCLMGSK